MKLITLNTLFSKAKLQMLLVLSLSIFSIAAMAATAVTPGKPQTDRFNHMTTGFPLTGAHLITECSSCHVEGVFKGTPRDCAGCHTKGRKVIATPKSAKHVPTDEACDVCHSNAVTFLGTRYNHGRAVPGQCTTCHNGMISVGRPASHTSTMKASKSCDSCHRTFVWLPATWNHAGNTAACVTCHATGRDGAAFIRTNVTGTTPEGFAHRYTAAPNCESCHSSYFSWYGAKLDHAAVAAGPTCDSCHNGSTATGTAQKPGHTSVAGQQCSACHTGTVSWLPALGAMPSNHIPFNAGTTCASCHTGSTVATGNTLHAYVSSTCTTCHNTTPVYLGKMTRMAIPGHQGSRAGQDCTSCHTRVFTRWSGA